VNPIPPHATIAIINRGVEVTKQSGTTSSPRLDPVNKSCATSPKQPTRRAVNGIIQCVRTAWAVRFCCFFVCLQQTLRVNMRRVRTLDTDRRQLERKKLQRGNFDLDADGRPSLRDHRPLSFDTAIAAHGRLIVTGTH
jgi:hypothetical protein